MLRRVNRTPNRWLRYLSGGRPFSALSAQKVSRGKNRARLRFAVDDVVNGFRVTAVTPIPDFDVEMYSMIHEKTGAEYVHVDAADTNNVFAVLFRTVPMDNTGVAHILEHTTLCGSEKYPVRDPFMNMIKRSLNTFMNAFTASDWTMYPFSTQNEKDFKNLLSVYLDAAFKPNLNKLDFLQEGHRFEYVTEGESEEKKLQIKGVVFNEMKGAMSDPNSLYHHRLQSLLFETNTYHYNSGGEPSAIPELSWEELKEFHGRFYHPSNARFFTYGDLAPSTEEIAAVCQQFEKIDPRSDIPLEPKRNIPLAVSESCPPTPGEEDGKESKVTISWLMNEVGKDLDETFGLIIMSDLLMSGPSSPMYKALIQPNIGSGYSPGTGYTSWHKQATFGVGLLGISKDDIPTVEDIVQKTLEQAAVDGFEEERVEAILHQIELSQKEVKSNFGLDVLMRIAPSWVHEVSPVAAFEVNKRIATLRKNLSEGPYFQELIKKHILANKHRVMLTHTSDPKFLEKQGEQEVAFVAASESGLSEADKSLIQSQAEALKANQETAQDPDCLPTLTVKDIAREPEDVDVALMTSGGVERYECKQPTNGIIYCRTMFDAHVVPDELRPYLPLYSVCLTSMGAGNLGPPELSDKIKLYTGGISADISASDSIFGADQEAAGFALELTSAALARNIDNQFDLMHKITKTPNFDFKDRLESVLKERAQDDSASLLEDGHRYALTYSTKGFSEANALAETLDGVSQVEFMNELAKSCPGNLDDLVAKLHRIHELLTNNGCQKIFVTGDKNTLDLANSRVDSFASAIGSSQSRAKIQNFEHHPSKTFISLPTQVNYAARAIPTVPYIHDDAPTLRVLSKLLSLNFLLKEIREKGGAYGAGAAQSGGCFKFYSYRDPEALKTLGKFDEAVQWACGGEFSDRDVDEALLSLFSDIDTPVPPRKKGLMRFRQGLTTEMQRAHRKRLLATTKQQLVDVAQKYLTGDYSVAVCGKNTDVAQYQDAGDWVVKTVSASEPEEKWEEA